MYLSGILKQVKDYMRQCSQCQNRQDRRGLSEDDTGPRLVGRPGRRRRVTTPASEEEEEEEEEEGDDEMDFVTSVHHKTRSPKTVAKHELVFVSVAEFVALSLQCNIVIYCQLTRNITELRRLVHVNITELRRIVHVNITELRRIVLVIKNELRRT